MVPPEAFSGWCTFHIESGGIGSVDVASVKSPGEGIGV